MKKRQGLKKFLVFLYLCHMKRKFNIGDRIKYRGDIYKITSITDWGYNVLVEEFTDPEDVKTGIGFAAEENMELYDGLTNYEKELKDIILDAFSNPNWESELKANARKLRILSNNLF